MISTFFFIHSVAVDVVPLLADCESYIVFRLLCNWLMPFSTSFFVLVRLFIRAQQQTHTHTNCFDNEKVAVWNVTSPWKWTRVLFVWFSLICMTNQIKWNLVFLFGYKIQYETKKRNVYNGWCTLCAYSLNESHTFGLGIHLNWYYAAKNDVFLVLTNGKTTHGHRMETNWIELNQQLLRHHRKLID